jgi:Ca2+-binding EF-hand superfamily protein
MSANWNKAPIVYYRNIVDEIEILGLYQQFLSLATDDSKEGGITKQVFEYCLGSIAKSRNIILDRMFCFYDQNGDGIITFDEMVCGLSILSKGSLEDKIFCKFGLI